MRIRRGKRIGEKNREGEWRREEKKWKNLGERERRLYGKLSSLGGVTYRYLEHWLNMSSSEVEAGLKVLEHLGFVERCRKPQYPKEYFCLTSPNSEEMLDEGRHLRPFWPPLDAPSTEDLLFHSRSLVMLKAKGFPSKVKGVFSGRPSPWKWGFTFLTLASKRRSSPGRSMVP